MRDVTRKRLERALLVRRIKVGAVALAAVALGAAAFYWQSRDIMVVATNSIGGTVVHVGPLAGKYRTAIAQETLQVDVRLDDTRVAHLLAPRQKAPKVGEHVTVADHVHGSGRHTFDWQ